MYMVLQEEPLKLSFSTVSCSACQVHIYQITHNEIYNMKQVLPNLSQQYAYSSRAFISVGSLVYSVSITLGKS